MALKSDVTHLKQQNSQSKERFTASRDVIQRKSAHAMIWSLDRHTLTVVFTCTSMGEYEAKRVARSLLLADHGKLPTKTRVPVELSRSARSRRMINCLQASLGNVKA